MNINSTINNNPNFGMAFKKPTGKEAENLAKLVGLPRNKRAFNAWVKEANKLKHIDIEYNSYLDEKIGYRRFAFEFKDHNTGKEKYCALAKDYAWHPAFKKGKLAKAQCYINNILNKVFHPEYTLDYHVSDALRKAQILEKRAINEKAALDIIEKA